MIWCDAPLRAMFKLGEMACAQLDELRYAAAVIGTAVYLSLRPRNWKRDARKAFARQVLVLGIEPVVFVAGVAVFVGVTVVTQLAYWTGRAGQSQLLGPLLVGVVASDLGPILTNLIVITRSSSAMTAELAALKAGGSVKAMEARGTDPFLSLVVPRVLGMCVSSFCLTIVFIVAALASGYFFGAWLGTGSRNLSSFTNTVLNALHPADMIGVLAKSVLPSLFTCSSCCIGGLGVNGSFTDIPKATQRALTRSIGGLFVITAVVSLLTSWTS